METAIIVVLVVIFVILPILYCCVVCIQWCCGCDDSSTSYSYHHDPENPPYISQEDDDNTTLEIGLEAVKLSLEDDYIKAYKTPCYVSYDCQHCTSSFTDETELIEHQEPDAQCRFYMYTKVRFTYEVQKAMLRRCKSADLIKYNYNESKDVVFKVLAWILRHKSNGGRFSTRFDREGSTKTGLKTRKATEFDFTVALLFRDEPTIADTEKDQFHVGKQASSTAHVWLSHRDSMKFQDCCHNRYLLPEKLKETFRQFVSDAAREIDIPLVQVIVSKAENGPAVKLTIISSEIRHHISVDCTPKIVVPQTCTLRKQALDWPREKTFQAYRGKDIYNILAQSIYLVPKKEQVWSVSLANYETALLHVFPNRSTEKKVLRYMKTKLEAWQTQRPELRPISSYMLKEVFFWLRENMSDGKLWTGNKCADRYYNFLQEMKFCFEKRQLLDYFNNATDHLKGKEKCIPKLLELVTQEMALLKVEKG